MREPRGDTWPSATMLYRVYRSAAAVRNRPSLSDLERDTSFCPRRRLWRLSLLACVLVLLALWRHDRPHVLSRPTPAFGPPLPTLGEHGLQLEAPSPPHGGDPMPVPPAHESAEETARGLGPLWDWQRLRRSVLHTPADCIEAALRASPQLISTARAVLEDTDALAAIPLDDTLITHPPQALETRLTAMEFLSDVLIYSPMVHTAREAERALIAIMTGSPPKDLTPTAALLLEHDRADALRALGTWQPATAVAAYRLLAPTARTPIIRHTL